MEFAAKEKAEPVLGLPVLLYTGRLYYTYNANYDENKKITGTKKKTHQTSYRMRDAPSISEPRIGDSLRTAITVT